MGRGPTLKRFSPLVKESELSLTTYGISSPFELLSRTSGQVTHALLTRPPLGSKPSARRLPAKSPARLACIRHAASVRPEPGSNSPLEPETLRCAVWFSRCNAAPVEPAKLILTCTEQPCQSLLSIHAWYFVSFTARRQDLSYHTLII